METLWLAPNKLIKYFFKEKLEPYVEKIILSVFTSPEAFVNIFVSGSQGVLQYVQAFKLNTEENTEACKALFRIFVTYLEDPEMKTVPLPETILIFAKQHNNVRMDFETGSFVQLGREEHQMVEAYECNPAEPYQAAVSIRARMGVLVHPMVQQLWGINAQIPQKVDYKAEGNKAFASGEYEKAIELYSIGIQEEIEKIYNRNEKSSQIHILYSNRAQAFIKNSMYNEALIDSEEAISLEPTWPKGYFRKAQAAIALSCPEIALRTLKKGLQKAPNNKELLDKLAEVEIICSQESVSIEQKARKAIEHTQMKETSNRTRPLDQILHVGMMNIDKSQFALETVLYDE